VRGCVCLCVCKCTYEKEIEVREGGSNTQHHPERGGVGERRSDVERKKKGRRVQHAAPPRARWCWWASKYTVRTDVFYVSHTMVPSGDGVYRTKCTTLSHHTTTSEREQEDRGGRKAHLHQRPPWYVSPM